MAFGLKAAAAAAAIAASASAASAATLVNGDFETGDLTGWTLSTTSNGANELARVASFDVDQDGAASDAANFLVGKLVGSRDDGGVSFRQEFTVDEAGLYEFGVDVAANGATGQNDDGGTFVLRIDGVAVDSFAAGFIASGATESATLSGAMTLGLGPHTFELLITRSFRAFGANAQQFVDDAFVASAVSAVPIPAPALLLLSGLVGLGFLSRKRA